MKLRIPTGFSLMGKTHFYLFELNKNKELEMSTFPVILFLKTYLGYFETTLTKNCVWIKVEEFYPDSLFLVLCQMLTYRKF